MLGYSPAALGESGIADLSVIHKDFPSGGLDGLSDKWHVSFANALVALTMIVCTHVEMLVVFPVVPTDILLFILYAGVVGIG
mgnify:CR=1 FL=1